MLGVIRQRLVDDDAHQLRFEREDMRRHLSSIAEHAFDADLARGATFADVYEVAVAELARLQVGSLDPDGLTRIFEPEFDVLPTVPTEDLAPDVPAWLHGGRSRAASHGGRDVVHALAGVLVAQAWTRVAEAANARVAERGLPMPTTVVGEVLDERELVELFKTASLRRCLRWS